MDEPDYLSDTGSAAAPRPPADRHWGTDKPESSASPTEGRAGQELAARQDSLLSIAGWAVAGVLAAAAPFFATFTITVRGLFFAAYDGWGRQDTQLGLFTSHGPRWGVVLMACAALLLILAALATKSLVRPDTRERYQWWPLLAVAAPCLLGGVATALVLHVQASEDSFAGADLQPGLVVGWGTCVWLSLASLILAAAASVLALRPAHQWEVAVV